MCWCYQRRVWSLTQEVWRRPNRDTQHMHGSGKCLLRNADCTKRHWAWLNLQSFCWFLSTVCLSSTVRKEKKRSCNGWLDVQYLFRLVRWKILLFFPHRNYAGFELEMSWISVSSLQNTVLFASVPCGRLSFAFLCSFTVCFCFV